MSEIKKRILSLFILSLLSMLFAATFLNTTGHANSPRYTRVNNTTIKETVPAGNSGHATYKYYVSDELNRSTGNLTFKLAGTNSSNSICNISVNKTGGKWYYVTSKIVNGYCDGSTKNQTNIAVNDSGSEILFFRDTPTVIKPALPGSATYKFEKINTSSDRQVYYQTSPTTACPALLTKADVSWGFIAPIDKGEGVNDPSSRAYQSIMNDSDFDSSRIGSCYAKSDEHEVRENNEKILLGIFGGEMAFWKNAYESESFFGINKNIVKMIGENAVGGAEAGEIVSGAVRIEGAAFNSDGADSLGGDDTSSCTIAGVGWFICPAITFMGTISDGAYSVIEDFLKIDRKLVSTNEGTYEAWSTFRTIANIVFVIIFLIIIYSQITSFGIGSYGVKKMLPRLIIAAILVNLSFIICQLLVDITQIIGASLSSFMGNLIPIDSASGTGVTWEGVIAKGLLIAAGVTALVVAIPVLFSFLIAALMTVVILIGRQAAIVILVAIAPLAFVAYLLPNTEQWFRRWLKMFWGLLIVYPVVALLYGGGKLASHIIYDSGGDITLNVVALGVSAIPLIMTPTLLRGALNATGTLGTKLSGVAGRTNSQAGKKYLNDTRLGEARRGVKNRFAVSRAKRRSEGMISSRVDNSRLGRALGLDKGASAASALVNKEYAQNVENEASLMERMSNSEIISIANSTGESEERRAAAQGIIMKQGGFDEKRAILEGANTASTKQRTALRQYYYSSGMNEYFGNGMGDKIIDKDTFNAVTNGEKFFEDAIKENAGVIKATTIVGSGSQAMKYMKEKLKNNTDLTRTLQSIESNPELKSAIAAKPGEHYDALRDSVLGTTTSQAPATTPQTTPTMQPIQPQATPPQSTPTANPFSTPKTPTQPQNTQPQSSVDTTPPPPGYEMRDSGLVIPRGSDK